MKPDKVLLILNTPPPYGGGEIRAKILYDYFIGNSNYYLITNSNKSQNKATQGKLTTRNIFNNINYQIKNCFSIFKLKPKVVYISIPKKIVPLLKILPVIFTCKLVNAKLVGELAGSRFFFLEKKGVIRKAGKFILKQFYQIRLLGISVQQQMRNYEITNTVVFDNGTDVPDYFLNIPKKIKKDTTQISFIGALHKNKGIYLLCETAKILSERNIPFKMNIVGEWENPLDKHAILHYIKHHKLDLKILFHGLKHGNDKWNILANTDLYLFPSYNEGQPISIIEALAFGIPVIASNVGAIPDTIKNNENGFVIEEQNAQLYADKIIYLIENPDKFYKISAQNLKSYKERFTVENYCKSVEKWLINI
jgi:glycosyltransferase involved in cell wall biosynthesis